MKAPPRTTPTSRPRAIGCAICKKKLSVVDYREVRLLTDWPKSDGRMPSARSHARSAAGTRPSSHAPSSGHAKWLCSHIHKLSVHVKVAAEAADVTASDRRRRSRSPPDSQ